MSYPETQLAAYDDIKPELSDKRKTVFDIIASHLEGLTLFEISDLLHWPINCVSGRVTELARIPWIKDSGQRRVNPASGKRGIVWIAIPSSEHLAITFDPSGQGAFA